MLNFTYPVDDLAFGSSVDDEITLIQQATGSEVLRDLTHAVPYQPLPQDITLRIDSSSIENPTKLGNAGEGRPARGRETIVGGFSIVGSTQDSTPTLNAWYTQCLAPTFTLLNGSGSTLPAAVDVVAAGGDLTAITAATIADSLSNTTNPAQLTFTPTGTDVTVVNAQSVAGGSALTIADDLSTGTDLDGYYPFQVTLTSATLTNADTPGTVTVVYASHNGGNRTTTLNFPNDQLTATQTIYLDNVDSITSVTPDGFSAGTLTATVKRIALVDSVMMASVAVWGTDHADNVIVEEFQMSRSEVLNVQTSEQYFKTVTAVYAASSQSQFLPQTGGVRVQGFKDGTFSITARDTAVRVEYPLQDTRVVRFMTAEVKKAGKPYVYRGLHPSQVDIAVDGNAIRVDTVTVMGRTGDPNTNLAGDTVVITPDAPPTLPQPTDTSGLDIATLDVFTGWESVLNIDGFPQPLESCTLTINQNFQDTQLVIGQRGNSGVATRAGKRMWTLSCVMRDAAQLDWFRAFRRGKTFKNVEIIFSYSAEGGFPAREIFGTAQAVMMSSPDPESSGLGPVQNNIELRAYNTLKGGVPNDFYVINELSRYVAPRTYTL